MAKLSFPIPIMFDSLLSVDLSSNVISFLGQQRKEPLLCTSIRSNHCVLCSFFVCYDTANELIVVAAIEQYSITLRGNELPFDCGRPECKGRAQK